MTFKLNVKCHVLGLEQRERENGCKKTTYHRQKLHFHNHDYYHDRRSDNKPLRHVRPQVKMHQSADLMPSRVSDANRL